MFSVSESDAEDAILKLAKNAEDAQAIVAYLSTIDWVQVISERRRERRDRVTYEVERRQKTWIEGGGYCDECGDEYNKLYSWPFASHDVDKQKCPIFPSNVKLSEEEWQEYLRKDKEYKDTLWDGNFGWYCHRFCWKCLYKQQQLMNVPYLYKVWRCSICDRFIRYKASYSIKHAVYCLHCIEQAIETQFFTCKECGKKTASINRDLCYNCYDFQSKYPSNWQVSTHLARARKAGAPATLTVEQWIAAIEYFGNNCAYCRSRPFNVLEHFLPISLGGGTTADNCVPACHSCNSRKNSARPDCFDRIFPTETIEHIKEYLQADKQQQAKVSPLAVNTRALVVRAL